MGPIILTAHIQANPGHKLGILQFNSILILSTLYHQILQVKGSILQDYPLQPLQMPITSPGCHLGFWPTGYRLEVPMTPSLGSINLLEWLTKLRKPVYLLDYWFIIKGYNSGTARWKRCLGQCMGKGTTLPCSLQVHHSPRCSPTWNVSNPIPLDFYGSFIT